MLACWWDGSRRSDGGRGGRRPRLPRAGHIVALVQPSALPPDRPRPGRLLFRELAPRSRGAGQAAEWPPEDGWVGGQSVAAGARRTPRAPAAHGGDDCHGGDRNDRGVSARAAPLYPRRPQRDAEHALVLSNALVSQRAARYRLVRLCASVRGGRGPRPLCGRARDRAPYVGEYGQAVG